MFKEIEQRIGPALTWERPYLEPIVEQVLLVLLNDQLRELHTLMRIELAASQQCAEVDEQRGGLARLRRDGLELLQSLPSPQGTLHMQH